MGQWGVVHLGVEGSWEAKNNLISDGEVGTKNEAPGFS